MFNTIDNITNGSSFYYGNYDVKLGFCRFVSEMLVCMSNGYQHNLDELVAGTNESEAYGGLLFMHYGGVFKSLYFSESGVDERGEKDKARGDIVTCLSVLLEKSKSAKRMAIEEGFLRKVEDVCLENMSALHLSEI